MLDDAAVSIELTAVHHESPPSARLRYGLTEPQHEALIAAFEAGYYAVPRDVTTTALAKEFGISDQALIERLRRAVSNLVEYSLEVETVG